MKNVGCGLYNTDVKYTFSIILLAIVTLGTYAVEIEIPQRKLSPDVKSVKISRSRSNDERPLPVKKIEYSFFGLKTAEHLYEQDGDIKWTIFYEYRNDNRIASKYAETTEGEILWRTDYEYDTDARLIKETTFDSNGKPDHTTVYEHQEDRTEILAYDSKGALQWRKKIITPQNRNIRETYLYYPGGTRIKGIVEEFDAYGKKYTETHIDEIGTIFRRIETTYDIFGRPVGRTVFDHRGDVHRRIWFEYLPHGHVGLVRQVIPAENREEEYTYSYEIDKRGSWIYRRERAVITDDSLENPRVSTTIETRDIEYFSKIEGQE